MPLNFFSVTLGFIIGVWFSSLFAFGLVFPALVLFLALVIFGGSFWFLDQEKVLLRAAALFLFFFALGGGRMELTLLNQNFPDWSEGQTVTVEGVVAEEPKPGETSNQLVLETPEKYHLLLITDLYPEYNYGDQLKVAGKLTQPKNFITDTGREFDYVNYLGRQEIYFEMFRPRIETLGGHQPILIWLKQKFLAGISKVLPEPQAGLLAGLLVSGRRSVDKSLLDQFQRVGLSHMVAISGYNLTVVAEAIKWLFSFLPLYFGLGFAATGVILFSFMAGGGPVIWRATLMALLTLFARATGRVYNAAIAFAFAVCALLIWDPTYLVFDFGFQLAVLATLGLIFLSPLVKVWLIKVPERFGLREIVASTIAAQIAVLPWILYQTGNLSLVALVVNPIVLVVVPLIMLLGFITGIIAFVSPLFAFIPGSVAYLLLSYQLIIVSFFSKLSFASVAIPSFPLAVVILIYGFYVYWYYRSVRIIKINEKAFR